jgi:hypothetical protein
MGVFHNILVYMKKKNSLNEFKYKNWRLHRKEFNNKYKSFFLGKILEFNQFYNYN